MKSCLKTNTHPPTPYLQPLSCVLFPENSTVSLPIPTSATCGLGCSRFLHRQDSLISRVPNYLYLLRIPAVPLKDTSLHFSKQERTNYSTGSGASFLDANPMPSSYETMSRFYTSLCLLVKWK